ncbi:MAG: hypothetical protein KDD42_02010 [Bdellovibrionales bacterium]|nr:hypothetical protein [Bdellovibrionales bacterium]
MKSTKHLSITTAKILTLTTAVLLTVGCTFVRSQFGETCKTRAHIPVVLEDYLSRRFATHSPVRIGLIPFSTPANLSGHDIERPGLGNLLVQELHRRLLASGEVPIIEILTRQDWPGKKEEFFTGNYGAIGQARNAGYDLVFVGFVERSRAANQMETHAKLIEVDSGITLWYATTNVETQRSNRSELLASLWLDRERPDQLYIEKMINKTSACLVDSLTDKQVS